DSGRGALVPIDASPPIAAASPGPVVSGDSTRLRTVDDRGRAVGNVPVVARHQGTTRALGRTDADGWLEVVLQNERPLILAGSSDDWLGERLLGASEPPAGATVEVLLLQAGRATGQVLDSRQRPVGADVLIVALPAAHATPTADRLEQLRAFPHDAPSARTDEQGRFELTGLDLEGEYLLRGAGSGWVLRQDEEPQVLTGAHWVCTADPLWAAAIELLDTDGRPAAVSMQLEPHGAERAEFLGTPLTPWPLETSAVRWNGLGATRVNQPAHVRLFAFTGGDPDGELAPFVYQALLPGYESASRRVDAVRVGRRPLRREPLTLSPRATGFGQVELMHLDAAGELRPLPEGELVLFDDSQVFRLHVDATPAGSATLGPVPHGRYGYQFKAADGTVQSQEQESGQQLQVVVGREPGLARVDLGPVGSVELQVRTPDGRPYWGSLTVMIGEPGGVWFDSDNSLTWSGVQRVHFAGPPYRLDPLPQGTFRFVLDAPFEIEIEGGYDISVEPGRPQVIEYAASFPR
ncbi:MAG: hypothetical protein ACYS26_17835, partial [Planctomycetota bacterium]